MLKKSRLLVLVVVIAAAALFMFSPGKKDTSDSGAQKADSGASKAEQSIKFALHSIPDSVDPGITSETYATPILVNAFEGLVTYDSHNNIIPGHAEKWEISDDGLTYTFHLRPGLKWSDGSALNAHDFVYSWLRVITPATGSLYSDQLLPYVVNAKEFFDGKVEADKVGIKALDDNTLEVKLISPTPFFLGMLGTYTFSPVQKATIEANKEKWTLAADTYVSNGPFKVTEIKFNDSYVFEKNENYWNAANVKLDKLTFVFISDPSTALTAFRAKEIDGLLEVPANDLPTIRAENSDELITVNSFGTTYHIFNDAKPPFDNPLVRKAFNLAIDRKSLIEEVLGNKDTPAFSLVSPGYVVDGVDVTDGRSTYGMSPNANPEEAKKALAEAGYPDGKGFPEIEYYYRSNDTYKKTVEALAQMLMKNLNIKIKLKTADWAVYYADVQAGKFQLGQYGWGGDYLHPMTFLPLFVTKGVNNYMGYSNPEYDKLVAQIQSCTDPKEAAKMVRMAEDTLMKDYPFLPLFFRSYSYMMSKNTDGYFRTPLNHLYFRDAFVK